jgi:hypothetical protein
MTLWTILFALLLVVLIIGFAVFHLAGALIESVNDQPSLD